MIGYVVNRCNYMGVSMAMGVPQVRLDGLVQGKCHRSIAG